MRKITKNILLIFIIIFLAVVIFEHALLVSVTKWTVKRIAELDIGLRRIVINPLEASVTLKGLKLLNPPMFSNRVLADIPLVRIDFKAKTFFEKGTFLDTVTIHIKELYVIKNKDGTVNLSQIKALTPREKPKESETQPFMIDNYVIQIETLKYIDYMKEGEDRERAIELNVDEEYKNVKDPANVGKIIVFKTFFNGKIGNIGLDIKKIQKDLSLLAEQNKRLSDEFAKMAEEKIEKAKDIVKEQVDKAKDALQDRIKDVKDKADEAKEAVQEKIEGIKESTDKPESEKLNAKAQKDRETAKE